VASLPADRSEERLTKTKVYNTKTIHLKIKQEIIISTLNTQNCENLYHQFTPDDMVRVNKDLRALWCTMRFCVITPEACSSPDGTGQRRRLGEGKL